MKLETRTSFGWSATAAGSAPCKNGMVAHYDGSDQGLAKKPHSACRDYWKDTRVFHRRPVSQGGRGWLDIGYSFGVCPHGIVFEGRGFGRQQAAQPGGNTTWTSCTFMSGEHETPTALQLEAWLELRAWLRGKGVAAAVRGHGEFISTSCPGGILRKMVKDGSLTKAAVTKPPVPTPVKAPNGTPVLERGASGARVGQLQSALNKAIAAKLKVDDDFGANTEDAVGDLQRKAKIGVDGRYGEQSEAALKRMLL